MQVLRVRLILATSAVSVKARTRKQIWWTKRYCFAKRIVIRYGFVLNLAGREAGAQARQGLIQPIRGWEINDVCIHSIGAPAKDWVLFLSWSATGNELAPIWRTRVKASHLCLRKSRIAALVLFLSPSKK